MKPVFKSLNFNRKGLERILGELEAAVMEEVWRCGEVSVRQVHARLAQRKLAYTTVMTVMYRLTEKGFLAKDKRDNAYVYRPLVSRQDLEKAMLTQVTDSLQDLALPAVANLVDHLPTDRSTLEELEKLIASKKALLEGEGE